jgi:ABC-type lipoprotein export system ATPase subunit
MSLLELDRVTKSGREDGGRERVVLREVSMDLEAGELAVVWGQRRSGRTTLLRVAAGIASADGGVVRFEGRDLASDGDELLGGGIGYCQRTFRSAARQTVLEQVTRGLLARRVSHRAARAKAHAALARTGVEHCARMRPVQLDSAETIRVALARTLALEPRLVVIDEPVKGVELLARDAILQLLSSIARDGVALLASTGEAPALTVAHRAFTLGDGELHGAAPAQLAEVLPLRRRAAG